MITKSQLDEMDDQSVVYKMIVAGTLEGGLDGNLSYHPDPSSLAAAINHLPINTIVHIRPVFAVDVPYSESVRYFQGYPEEIPQWIWAEAETEEMNYE